MHAYSLAQRYGCRARILGRAQVSRLKGDMANRRGCAQTAQLTASNNDDKAPLGVLELFGDRSGEAGVRSRRDGGAGQLKTA